MFTGIIQHKVKILQIIFKGQGMHLSVEKPQQEKDWEQGESISINGVCLSVEKVSSSSLSFFAQKETMTGVLLIRFPTKMRSKLGESINILVDKHSSDLMKSFTVLEPGRARIRKQK